MKHRIKRSLAVSALTMALFYPFATTQSAWAQSPNVSVFATGLNNPRGLKFGPNGAMGDKPDKAGFR